VRYFPLNHLCVTQLDKDVHAALAILAYVTCRCLRNLGSTHDFFFLAGGEWGCAVYALHVDELAAATALSRALLRLKGTALHH
jgi:hypothetical protein